MTVNFRNICLETGQWRLGEKAYASGRFKRWFLDTDDIPFRRKRVDASL